MPDFLIQFGSHGTWAYLDGGTGSMLLQAALAGILTALYAVKVRWASVRQAINRRHADKNSDA